jgi:outer membrane protein assembly factor BamB
LISAAQLAKTASAPAGVLLMNRSPFLPLTFSLLLAASAFSENWPRFRGPTGQGISTETGLPLEWNGSNGIKWRAEIPGEGWSSPIVWNDRVFVTTATDGGTSCRVLCLDRASGQELWNTEVFQQTPKRKEGKNSYATPTPVTDGESVFAVFGDGSFAALDFGGKLLWTHRDVKFYSQHGLGASPILHGDLLIMPFDGSSEGDDKSVGWQKPWDQSFILALDKRTGKERWRAQRGMSRIAHGTPLVVKIDGRDVLLSNAGDVVQGFDPATGERLWSVRAQGEGVVPSLSFGDGLVFSSSGFEKSTIRGIRPGTEPQIAWEQTKGVPKMSSFIYANGHLFSVSDGGVAMCQKGDTGAIIWQERIGGAHSASPVLAEGRIYFQAEGGETIVIDAAPQLRVLARNKLPGRFQASTAVSQGCFFLRSEREVICVGE